MVTQLPEDDTNSMTRQQMMARLVVCMGGRAAEEKIFGKEEVTSGMLSGAVAEQKGLLFGSLTLYASTPHLHFIRGVQRRSAGYDAGSHHGDEVCHERQGTWSRAASVFSLPLFLFFRELSSIFHFLNTLSDLPAR